MLPSLSLSDIGVIIELTWWIKYKDHPSFSEMAGPILENFITREVTAEKYFNEYAVGFSRQLLKNLADCEVDPPLAEAIKLEIEMRVALNS
jgi:hypothetical protein